MISYQHPQPGLAGCPPKVTNMLGTQGLDLRPAWQELSLWAGENGPTKRKRPNELANDSTFGKLQSKIHTVYIYFCYFTDWFFTQSNLNHASEGDACLCIKKKGSYYKERNSYFMNTWKSIKECKAELHKYGQKRWWINFGVVVRTTQTFCEREVKADHLKTFCLYTTNYMNQFPVGLVIHNR